MFFGEDFTGILSASGTEAAAFPPPDLPPLGGGELVDAEKENNDKADNFSEKSRWRSDVDQEPQFEGHSCAERDNH